VGSIATHFRINLIHMLIPSPVKSTRRRVRQGKPCLMLIQVWLLTPLIPITISRQSTLYSGCDTQPQPETVTFEVEGTWRRRLKMMDEGASFCCCAIQNHYWRKVTACIADCAEKEETLPPP
jgi:hypothetical protein